MRPIPMGTRNRVLRAWLLPLAWLGAALGLVACGGGQEPGSAAMNKSAAATVAATGASVTGLNKVSEVRVGRTVYDYVFKVNVSNTGPALSGAAAMLGTAGAGTTIIDGQVQIGNLAAGGSVTPADTITLRHDRAFPFDPGALRWQITGTPSTSAPTASASIGPSGGTVGIPGGASVTIPPGALTTPVTITVSELANHPSTLPPGGKHVGKVYSFEPHGLVFQVPVTLNLPYDPALIAPSLTEGDVAVGFQLPDGSIEMIGGYSDDPEAESTAHQLDQAQNMVSVRSRSFSVYAAITASTTAQFTPALQTLGGASVTIHQPTTGGMRLGYARYHRTCVRIQNNVAIPDSTQDPLPDRVKTTIENIVIHSTNSGVAAHTFDKEIAWATSKCNGRFAHYYINRTGDIYQIVDDLEVAQHAAPKNTPSLGIELYNNVGEPYDGRQIAALIRLIDFLAMKYKTIQLPSRDAATGLLTRDPVTDSILTHNDVSGKCDPIGTFRSSSVLITANVTQGCQPAVPLGSQRTPNLAGGPAGPALVDLVVDAVAALGRSAKDTGVINTSGGDGNAAGIGGPVKFATDPGLVATLLTAGELTASTANKLLFIPPGVTHHVGAGTEFFTDVIIAGTLVVEGPAELRVTGTFYLAPNGRILVSATNQFDGGGLTVRTLGSPIIQGLIDATGKHDAGVRFRGGDGGKVEFHSQAFQNLLLPTIITRGGNATTSVLPYTGTGGAGGSITIHSGSANLFVGGGNGPAFGVGPAFRDGITVTSLPPFYIGAELPPPPPFNLTSGGATPVAGQRTPLRALPTQTGFTRGLLTSGGMGAFGEPAGAGGAGGHITILGTGMLTMRDIDLITGADVETVRGGVFLQDGVQHFYYAASGSLGGKATTTAAVKDGGPGGAAGSISVQGVALFPLPAHAAALTGINGFGQPNGQPVPRTTDIPLSSVFRIGETRQVLAADGTKLYRLRIDSLGTGLAGGSGGMPGGSPFVLFPGRFGQQGQSGVLTGLPK
ncbi:N-acetylmuramoyl-L-alanine amidase [Massilia sp. ST3]|uniref:N-acetylmuramoyl-L-alanine amidase n=1 Tax=Massilia sp. ST3 TaxID=2824903 RepID=UPI001B8410F4|nr:N-acetylmuramoyl-L-alanine amidase [Massilia sp. ST3]MBQ5946806.1 N-acetylmuramoyl-L-alanine amidase [Massilia sp. ST3]